MLCQALKKKVGGGGGGGGTGAPTLVCQVPRHGVGVSSHLIIISDPRGGGGVNPITPPAYAPVYSHCS